MPLLLSFNYYYVETFTVTFIQHCYGFRIKTMFGSSLPPVVCRTDHVLFVSNRYCVVLVFCLSLSSSMLSVSLYCLFLIATSRGESRI